MDDARRTEALMRRFLENPMSPDEVEKRSFEVIEAEVTDRHLSPDEWIVARRMIHASADLSLVGDIFFSPGVIRAAVTALIEGAPIYVDANMIRAGLSLPRLKRVNPKYDASRVVCHVADPDVAKSAKAAGLPRSIFAVQKARALLDGGIAVFGNAPLALIELNRMIIEEALCPAFVVAMPVGFVHVVESKAELDGLGVPHVSVHGRRGGSPLAISALHALCSIAERQKGERNEQ
jgi:precorrin-8X/cobalt-precorrin-8 methylmutase